MSGAAQIPISFYNTFVGKKTGMISTNNPLLYNPWVGVFPGIWYGPCGYGNFPGFIETRNNSQVGEYVRNRNWLIEESRIQGGFNETIVSLGVRAYANVDNPNQLHRSNSLIYSGVFNSRTGFNETNVFSIGEQITKSVDPFYGSIQQMYTSDSNLTVFQERKTGYLLVDKDALYTAEGSANVTSTNMVLGQYVPFQGDYGISKNPESFAWFGFRQYFSDVHRGKVMRLSRDGLTPISDFGLNDFIRDQSGLIEDDFQVYQISKECLNPPAAPASSFVISPDLTGLEIGMGVRVDSLETQAYIVDINYATNEVELSEQLEFENATISFVFFKYIKDRVIGAWDNFNKQYTISYQKALLSDMIEEFSFLNTPLEIKNTSTLSFDEEVRGWNSYYTYRPTDYFSLKGNFYSFKQGKLWKHYSTDVINNRGTFYNINNPSSIVFVVNTQPSTKKVFQTVNYEGDNGFEVVYLNSDIQRVDPDLPITNPGNYVDLNQYNDSTSSNQFISIASYDEGLYTLNGFPQRAGFDRKENLYVANLINRSTVRPGEIIYGSQMSGVKGYFLTAKISTDESTNVGGLKELWSIGTKYVMSS